MASIGDVVEVLTKRLWSPKLVVVHAEKIVLCSGAYEAEDVVSEATSGATPFIFKNCARYKGGGGYIVHSVILAQTTAIGAWFALYLHAGLPTCALNDDVANTAPKLEDRFIYQGRINYDTCTGLGTNEMDSAEATPSDSNKLPKAFVCASGSKDLQGVMVIRNAVDLADSTVLHPILWIEQY
uniref:Uncharacterized protein n=1 Tax=viral metagenome TaxID=1070528 RepID=A0A6M3Y2E7_9ZZZZ